MLSKFHLHQRKILELVIRTHPFDKAVKAASGG